MHGDDALCSTAALILKQFVAKSADNFAMKGRSRGRRFKSLLLYHPVSGSMYMSENRSKFARVRANLEHARTQRASPASRNTVRDRFVVTWSYDKAGDFTHTAQQWKHLAWLRPSTAPGRLVFNIIKPQNAGISWEVYGIYHGRFIETVIIHCHTLFTSAQATAAPTQGDIVS